MQELIAIIQERRQTVNQIKAHRQERHKSELIQQQRKRNQRQNWILRVIKTLKVPSAQQKKIIYQTIIKIMNFYQQIQRSVERIQNVNYTQIIINLFVEFYNKFANMDLNHIKIIIRPNNNYIIVDLIKTLIQLSRKQFKNIVLQQFKELPPLRSDRKFSHKNIIKCETSSSKTNTEQYDQPQNTIDNTQKIQSSLYQKYSKAIDHFDSDANYERFNQLYFDLLYLNQKNAIKIQRYIDSCFGAKRHINYDVSGLYTQQQIKNMKNQKRQRTQNIISDIKDLKVGCTTQQLKQYFKLKVQLHQSMSNFPSFQKCHSIRHWFPIVYLKKGDKLHPYNLMIEVNQSYYSQTEFQQKYSKKLKVYIKQLLNQQFQSKEILKFDHPQMVSFNKKSFLDFNNTKLLQLMTKQVPNNFRRDKEAEGKNRQKQRFLPTISDCYHGQTDDINKKSKAKSLSKLPNTSLIIPPNKKENSMSQIFEKRLNYSSFVNNMSASKNKMDYLIDNILKSREYALQ